MWKKLGLVGMGMLLAGCNSRMIAMSESIVHPDGKRVYATSVRTADNGQHGTEGFIIQQHECTTVPPEAMPEGTPWLFPSERPVAECHPVAEAQGAGTTIIGGITAGMGAALIQAGGIAAGAALLRPDRVNSNESTTIQGSTANADATGGVATAQGGAGQGGQGGSGGSATGGNSSSSLISTNSSSSVSSPVVNQAQQTAVATPVNVKVNQPLKPGSRAKPKPKQPIKQTQTINQ